jgi:hypothetical protein
MFGTSAFSTAATIFSASGGVHRPSGFSHITILPAFAAAMAISAWVSFGLAMSMSVDILAARSASSSRSRCDS